jgi:hypothetical protein
MKSKFKIGDVVIALNGRKLIVVDMDSYSVTLADEEGITSIRNRRAFVRNSESLTWFDEKARKYVAGGKFMMNCGVELEIVKIHTKNNITVIDSLGNTGRTSEAALKNRSARWAFPHPDNRYFRYKLGDTFLSAKGYLLTVVKRFKHFKYLLEDVDGNTKIVGHSIREIRKWPFRLKSDGISPKGYYVYVAHLGGEPLYIGSGKGYRWKHVNSGESHNYLLNEHFFLKEDKLIIEIFKDGLSQVESLQLEFELIKKHSPIYNRQKAAGHFKPPASKTKPLLAAL